MVSILILMDRGLKEKRFSTYTQNNKKFQSLFLWTEDLKSVNFGKNRIWLGVSILILMDRGLKAC